MNGSVVDEKQEIATSPIHSPQEIENMTVVDEVCWHS